MYVYTYKYIYMHTYMFIHAGVVIHFAKAPEHEGEEAEPVDTITEAQKTPL